ncbi:MAG: hypothetical protein KGY99_03830 [Phycisphaerae bacterium]|nr:hypothetical protein [Phycisphaerae bacterium]
MNTAPTGVLSARRRRYLTGFLVVLTGLTAASARDAATRPSAVPTTAPATQPGAPPSTPPVPSTRPVRNAGAVSLTEGLWRRWQAAVTDSDRSPTDEDSFYKLLTQVAEMEPFDAERIAQLDRPGYQTLVEDPRRHVRLPIRPMQMTVRVRRVYVLTPRDHLSPTRHWSGDRPIYLLNAVTGETEPKPVLIYMAQDPQDVLGEPDSLQVNEKSKQPYREYTGKLPRVRLVGLYYKAYDDMYEDADGAMKAHRWPVILAAYLEPTGGADDGLTATKTGVIVAILLMLVALFVYLKRRTRPAEKSGGEQYEPLRDRLGTPDSDGNDSGEIDPDLRSAVEDYRKNRQKGDDQDASR